MGILKVLFGFIIGLITGKKAKGGSVIDTLEPYRTEEQDRAKFYFSEANKKGCLANLKGCFKKKEVKAGPPVKKKGCFPKKPKFISDADYDALVNGIVNRYDPKAKALSKLNIDESEIVKTITFGNYVYNPLYESKYGEDGIFRSLEYQVTYIFLTQKQILVYQLTLSCDWEKHDENTFEYFYKDVTSFKTETVTQDLIVNYAKEYRTQTNLFRLVVPNDSFFVSLRNKPTQEEESAIQAMKQMIREKKS